METKYKYAIKRKWAQSNIQQLCETKSRLDETNNSNKRYISEVYIGNFDISNSDEIIINKENEIVIKVLVSIKVDITYMYALCILWSCINLIRENIYSDCTSMYTL